MTVIGKKLNTSVILSRSTPSSSTAWVVFPVFRIARKTFYACPSIPNTKDSETHTGRRRSSRRPGSAGNGQNPSFRRGYGGKFSVTASIPCGRHVGNRTPHQGRHPRTGVHQHCRRHRAEVVLPGLERGRTPLRASAGHFHSHATDHRHAARFLHLPEIDDLLLETAVRTNLIAIFDAEKFSFSGRDMERILPHLALYLSATAPLPPAEILKKLRLVEIQDSENRESRISELREIHPR